MTVTVRSGCGLLDLLARTETLVGAVPQTGKGVAVDVQSLGLGHYLAVPDHPQPPEVGQLPGGGSSSRLHPGSIEVLNAQQPPPFCSPSEKPTSKCCAQIPQMQIGRRRGRVTVNDWHTSIVAGRTPRYPLTHQVTREMRCRQANRSGC